MLSELTPESTVDGRVPTSPALSPDGRWVAYVQSTTDRATKRPAIELWVAAADGSVPPRLLDASPARVSMPRWAADSASILFLSGHATPGAAQLYRIGRDGGPLETLTGWHAGVDDYRMLADPDLVALIAADEPTELDERRDAERDDAFVRGQEPRAGLRLLNLRTGGIETPARFEGRQVVDVVQRPDGGPLAVLTWSSPDMDPGMFETALHLLDPYSGKVCDLGPAAVDAHGPVWWRDTAGWHLSYLGITPPHRYGGTAVVDLAVPEDGSPAGPHRDVTAGMTACPMELVQVDGITGDGGTPLVLVADGLDTAIHRLVPEGPALVELSRHAGLVHQLATDRTGELVATTVSTSHHPRDIYAGAPEGPLTRLTDTKPELRDIRWSEQERLSYRAADGLELAGLLILPPGKSRGDGPFPLVTLVHGGPYERFADQRAVSWAAPGQLLAQGGYAVFMPNGRGSLGRGHEFAASVVGRIGQEEFTDILTGIDLLIAGGVADPDRLGIAGWSHGGFMAAWAVGHTDRFAAAVMGAGISDWGVLGASSEGGIFDLPLRESSGWEGVGPHRHDELSPISYASAVRTPVLIVHGEGDTNVPLSQSEYFHRALRHFGVTHEFVVYPREGHAFVERTHRLDLIRRTCAWFDRWLMPPA